MYAYMYHGKVMFSLKLVKFEKVFEPVTRFEPVPLTYQAL